MAFAQFTSIDQVLRRYDLTLVKGEFVRPPTAFPPPSPYVLDELAYTLAHVPFQRSEVLAGEAVIYPILRDVWKHYADHLTLFSHEPVEADEVLRGELDYFVCRRSRHGQFTPDEPILLVGEAKRDDPSRGWAQALAGMMAARLLDPAGGRVLYGLATTGRAWSFGRLDGNLFTEDPRSYSVTEPHDLYAALHFVFAACRDILLQPPAAA